jgi:hypothetical protein
LPPRRERERLDNTVDAKVGVVATQQLLPQTTAVLARRESRPVRPSASRRSETPIVGETGAFRSAIC